MANEIPELETKKQSFIRKNYGLMAIGIVMAVILISAIVTFVTQPPVPSASNVYSYMQNNFNSTISNYTGEVNVTVYNSTIYLPGNPLQNLSAVTVHLNNITADNKTYIFFFGVEASGQSAVETYVLWSYLTKTPFPSSYNGSFVSSQGSIPILTQSLLLNKIAVSNPVFSEFMIPLTYQQTASQSNTTNTNFMGKWLAYNVSVPQAYIFAYKGKGQFPQVDVARTVGNKTIVCNGFSPINFIVYNTTSSTKFLGENMAGQTFGSLLPTTISMNADLNTLNSCVKVVSAWKGT